MLNMRSWRPGLCLAALSWLLSMPAWAAQQVFEGRVVAVHDGDSLQVRDPHGRRHRIRLAFIDAPELQQAYGRASRNALRGRLLDQQVQVMVLEQDRYRRSVAQIHFQGEDMGLWQLQQGAAWHYRSLARSRQSRSEYAHYDAAEISARHFNRGLWQGADPTPPWRFRRQSSSLWQ